MASVCPDDAPRQRSTATVRSFCLTWAWIALATPMPPSSSAMKLTRLRK